MNRRVTGQNFSHQIKAKIKVSCNFSSESPSAQCNRSIKSRRGKEGVAPRVPCRQGSSHLILGGTRKQTLDPHSMDRELRFREIE